MLSKTFKRMNWIDNDLTLEGNKVILRPLQQEHIEKLLEIGCEPKIWEFLGVNHKDENFARKFFEEGLANRDKGTQFPFTIFDKENSILGTTRFGEIMPEHRTLEIGWTWYIPQIWGKGYNEECKYLLLQYCFERLKAIRVQLKTNEKNIRSRRAIQRIGCRFEGILRNHVIRHGVTRNTAMFSMLPEEWETAKHKLRALAEEKYAGRYSYIPDIINLSFGKYVITTDKTKMQPERVHHWLSSSSYWLPGVPFETVQTTFSNSFCIAVLHEGVQVGYARLVTDYGIFAYLADVYIEEAHRGKGLGKKMMEALLSLDWVKRLKKLVLITKDAHGLYRQYGFENPLYPDRYMENNNPANNG